MSGRIESVKTKIWKKADDWHIERTREASIGLYTIIGKLYKNNDEIYDACKKLIELLNVKDNKEITPEMKTLSDFIIYKMKEDPLKTRKLRRELDKALSGFNKITKR